MLSGIIIRADGTIPFDTDVLEIHKQAMLDYLRSEGLVVELQPDGTYKIKDWV